MPENHLFTKESLAFSHLNHLKFLYQDSLPYTKKSFYKNLIDFPGFNNNYRIIRFFKIILIPTKSICFEKTFHYVSKVYFSIVIFFLSTLFSVAQQVKIKGKVFGDKQNLPLEFANVALLTVGDSALVTGGMSDLEGNFEFGTNPGN